MSVFMLYDIYYIMLYVNSYVNSESIICRSCWMVLDVPFDGCVWSGWICLVANVFFSVVIRFFHDAEFHMTISTKNNTEGGKVAETRLAIFSTIFLCVRVWYQGYCAVCMVANIWYLPGWPFPKITYCGTT